MARTLSVDLRERVTHLIIFRGALKLRGARNLKDEASVPREVVALPRPLSLDEVLTTQTNGAPVAGKAAVGAGR